VINKEKRTKLIRRLADDLKQTATDLKRRFLQPSKRGFGSEVGRSAEFWVLDSS